MADASDERDLVLLELHARPSPVSEAPPGQLGLHVLDGDREPRRQALDDDDERFPVRFAGGEEAEHRCNATEGSSWLPPRLWVLDLPLEGELGLEARRRAHADGLGREVLVR